MTPPFGVDDPPPVTDPFGGQVRVSYRTAVVDLLAAAPVDHPFVMPSRPGFIFSFQPATSLLHVVTRAGVATGALQWAWAQNGISITNTNINMSVANLNTATPPLPWRASIGQSFASDVDGTLPIQARTVLVPTGLTALTGWWEIFGAWWPV